MRRFLLKILLFSLPALLLLAAAECTMRRVPTSYRLKHQWMKANGPRVSTLILGNSHAFYALSPAAMGDSIFNLSNVSQRLEQDYYLLLQYAPLCPHLKTVVLVADNSNLFDQPMEADEDWRMTFYKLYMDYRGPSRQCFFAELAHISSFRMKAEAWLKGEMPGCDSLGWGNGYRAEFRSPSALSPHQPPKHLFHDWVSTHCNVQRLRQIAAWCQQRRVRLVILMPPVSPVYTALSQPWQLDYVASVARRCSVDFQSEVADFSRDDRFSDADFFDIDHLSSQGALKFSGILAAEAGL